jgi:hypothetical protein
MGFATIARECPDCGSAVSPVASACRNCGRRVVHEWPSFAIVGALGLLLAAVAVAATTVFRWQQLPAATATGAAADRLVAAASRTDFSWLATAMSDCDAIARANPSPLHFLLTPLAVVAQDTTPWRAKSINDRGDGILLRADDALGGLKNASLKIFPGDYVFSLTDDATHMVYRWQATTGVARFANADATAVSSFKVKFATVRGDAGSWGTTFNRQNGTCYWVNPVLGGQGATPSAN